MKKLFDTIEKQDVEEVRRLVAEKNFDPNSTRRGFVTYMLVAANVGNVEIGRILKDAVVRKGPKGRAAGQKRKLRS